MEKLINNAMSSADKILLFAQMNQRITLLNPSEEKDLLQISFFYETKLTYVLFNELILMKQTDRSGLIVLLKLLKNLAVAEEQCTLQLLEHKILEIFIDLMKSFSSAPDIYGEIV